MKRWEEEYIYTHIQVSFLLFQSSPRLQLAQVAFWAELVPVVVAMHPCLCASSVSVDSLWCHFGKEGSYPCDFHEPLLGVF
jgi:hypothetical protein